MLVSSGSAVVRAAKEGIVITELIKAQALEFAVMLGCGMIIALLYSFFVKNIAVFVRNVILNFLCEIVFWIFAALLTCKFLYYSSFGALKIHIIIAFICGVFLWKRYFCDKITAGDYVCLGKREKEAVNSRTQVKS